MSDYILCCGSTADLSKERFVKRNIKYICYHYYLDGKHYFDDLGETLSCKDFYQAMRDGADTRTSQINIDEFEDFFTGYLEQGKDIIYIGLSGGISGANNSARIAAEQLCEKYPGRKIYIVDSLAASSGVRLASSHISMKMS